MKKSEYLLIFTLCIMFICIIILILINHSQKENSSHIYKYINKDKQSKCSIDKCIGIDPVSDPKYNMQQIVKQSILLEEHLANKNKRCRDCITKHFLHIIGLAEEAQMLATKHVNDYPLINECVEQYNILFEKWLQNYDISVEQTSLNCCDTLRILRKKLIAVYFFDDKYKIVDK